MWVWRCRRNSPLVVVSPGKTAWQKSQMWDCSATSDISKPPDCFRVSTPREGLSDTGIWYRILKKEFVRKNWRTYGHMLDVGLLKTPTLAVCRVPSLPGRSACTGFFDSLEEAPCHLEDSRLDRGATFCSNFHSSFLRSGKSMQSLDISPARRSDKVPTFVGLFAAAVNGWGFSWKYTGISWEHWTEMDIMSVSSPLGTVAPAGRKSQVRFITDTYVSLRIIFYMDLAVSAGLLWVGSTKQLVSDKVTSGEETAGTVHCMLPPSYQLRDLQRLQWAVK